MRLWFACVPVRMERDLPGTKPWAVSGDIAAWQFKELETWYERQYQSVPGRPAPA